MTWITDANTAVARVAYQLSEVLAVYPITPSTSMAESCEQWASQQKSNLLGDVPKLVEMQSEAGSIAVVHGAAMSGALATTFTSSQGLLLMIPSLYKLAGELTPCVIHVAARTVATHALSIYCDHSDVMAIRQTGVAMLCASNAQEAQDLAAIATFSALQCRLPFVHFFDGFLTSHAITQIEPLSEEALSALLPMPALVDFRTRALRPIGQLYAEPLPIPTVTFSVARLKRRTIKVRLNRCRTSWTVLKHRPDAATSWPSISVIRKHNL